MRIVGNIPHRHYKITIFLHDSKYSLKFESGLYELVYQFRSGNLVNGVEDLKKLTDESFLQQIDGLFRQMHLHKTQALERQQQSRFDDFEDII